MQLHPFDWFFIVGYGVVAFGISLWYSKRASENVGEFFIAGRKLTWWMAGTSIVATTFAADTPLVVSGLIRSGGIYKNWLWWAVLMGGMMCVFFFARLWRRAEVLTDVEFVEFRYEGKSASLLRGFLAIYKGVLANCITMGWVTLAMSKVLSVMLGWDKTLSLAVLITFALVYTLMSGFWGVVMTDLVQFVMAMFGSYALAIIVLWKMGGPSGMVKKVMATPAYNPKVFEMIPSFNSAFEIAFLTFLVLVSVKWWSYGQGSGYISQRLFATRTEKDSMLAALWFNVAHYVLRPWPWIVVGIASLVYFPLGEDAARMLCVNPSTLDPELAYPQMMLKFLPIGLRGLMVASLLAAFMSTIDTHLNWGASYLVNDVYKRFVRPEESPGHYVQVSRWMMLLLAVLGVLVAWQMKTIKGAWIYLMVLTSGGALVGLLRWYWWRVNPWSEISAMVASLILANGLHILRLMAKFKLLSPASMVWVEWFYSGKLWAIRLFFILLICTLIWIAVTFLTRPTSTEKLEVFYRRVRPGGWWGPIAEKCTDVPREPMLPKWLGWLSGVACVYSALFGFGYLLLDKSRLGIVLLVVSGVCGWLMLRFALAQESAPASNTEEASS